jgi:small, acid-soluble spore protein tlp
MAKPDNRADNAEHLQEHIANTQQNINETEQYLNEFSSEMGGAQQNELQEKNERRRESLAEFEEELEDEEA